MRVKLNNKPIADVIDLYLLIKQLIVDVMIDLLFTNWVAGWFLKCMFNLIK